MVMSEKVPVYDNHIHMSPSGRNVDALREFEAAGGTGLTLVTLPYKEVRIADGADFARSYEITYSLAQKARECTDLEINIAVGPYPVLIIPLAEAYGLERAEEMLMKQIRVAQAMKALGRMRIGLIGGRVPGFFTSCVDEMMLRRTLGPEVKIITEHELFTVAQNLTADEVAKGLALIDGDLKTHPTDGPRGDQKEKSARLIAAVMKLKEKFFVDTFAMRCWPEVILNEFYGIAVCSTLGHLTNHGYLTACEGDVYGAVMMRIGQILSGDLPFFCDLIICEGDHGTVWHCGAAPCALCKPGYQPELHCSATVEGGGVKGCTGEFPLKPGRVTLARLGETRDGTGFRMLVCTGTGLDTDLFVRGTPLDIRFDAGCEAVRREVMENGWEHHYALMYGDRTEELTALCRNLNIEMHLVR